MKILTALPGYATSFFAVKTTEGFKINHGLVRYQRTIKIELDGMERFVDFVGKNNEHLTAVTLLKHDAESEQKITNVKSFDFSANLPITIYL